MYYKYLKYLHKKTMVFLIFVYKIIDKYINFNIISTKIKKLIFVTKNQQPCSYTIPLLFNK